MPCSLAGRARFAPILAAVAAVVLLAALLLRPTPGRAQGGGVLEAASPASNARLTESPAAIGLRFAGPIDPALLDIRLYGPGAVPMPLAPAEQDPADPQQAFAGLTQPLGDGAWTVAWSARLASGPVVSGTYGFIVGPPPTPGAAILDSDWPSTAASVARWLVALGLALAGGALLASRLAAPGLLAPAGIVPTRGAWLGAGAAGATLALLAAVAQPLLLSFASADANVPLSIGGAIAQMPPGWLQTVAGSLVLAIGLLALLAMGHAADRVPGWTEWLGLVVALAALDGFARSGGAAPDIGAAAAAAVHTWASAFWAGSLAMAAIARGGRGSAAPAALPNGGSAPVGARTASIRLVRLSWAFLGVAVVSGAAASWAAWPRFAMLWSSTWGWALVAKFVLVVLAALLVAVLIWFGRGRAGGLAAAPNAAKRPKSATVGAGAQVPENGARSAIRAGAAVLAALALLGGSLMTLSALPASQLTPTLASVVLAAAAPVGPEREAGRLDLSLTPAIPGENTVVVRVADANGGTLPASEAPMLEVAFRPLDHAAPEQIVNPVPSQTGGFALAGVNLTGAGWWQADVTMVPPDGQGTRVTQYFVLPDPNVTGYGPTPPLDPAARAVFDRGMAFFDQLRSARYAQRLGDGSGVLFQSVTEISDATDDHPATYRTVTAREELIIYGDTQWSRRFTGDGQWEERAASSLFLPSEWADVYAASRGFQLGPVEEVDGEPSQVVTFYLPRGRSNAPAWYAWWVGQETGAVHREAMISQRHYMVYSFSDFDADFGIVPPAERQGPPSDDEPAASPIP